MGTRSITRVFTEEDEFLLFMYRQMDGYPEGHGMDLANFLSGRTIVNGIREENFIANGMKCLAAQIVAHFKDGPGGIYIEPVGEREYWPFIEFVYDVKFAFLGKEAKMIVHDVRRGDGNGVLNTLFECTASDYKTEVKKHYGEYDE